MGIVRKRLTILLAVIILVAAFFVFKLLSDSKVSLVKIFSKECLYEGVKYRYGDRFPASDGCNTCSCGEDGKVSCTLMFCGE